MSKRYKYEQVKEVSSMGTTVDYADEILTVKELGKKLKLGRDKTYSLVRSDGFPSVKLGGRYIVTTKALNEWLSRYEYKNYVL